MKYTVTIQQPVQEDQRRSLEQQLGERFGLNPEQSGRLSGRRTGRLMKPTSRARAELLLDVFQLAGAAVALEEVPEETQLISEPFQGVATSSTAQRASAGDEVFLAPLLAPPAWPSTFESGPAAGTDSFAAPFSGGVAAVAAPVVDRVGTALAPSGPFASSGLVQSGDSFFPAMPASTGPSNTGLPNTGLPSTGLSNTGPSDATAPGDAPPVDVWADFAGSLSLPSAAPETSNTGAGNPLTTTVVPAVIPTVDMGAAAQSAASRAPRRSLTRQLTLDTLIPLAVSGAATLLVLALAVPAIQRQSMQQNAQTLATVVGTTLGGLTPAQINAQLGSVIAAPGVGFVQTELPGAPATLRAQNAQVLNLGKELSAWLTTHPNGGLLKLGQTQYVVARATFQRGSSGQTEAVPAGATSGSLVLRRVVVGVPNSQANAALRTTLLIVLLTLLIGLLVASLMARRAARQITDPIDRLVKAADAISMGDLSRPVQADRNDEIGDLALALERMRQSLEAAMERLRRRRRN